MLRNLLGSSIRLHPTSNTCSSSPSRSVPTWECSKRSTCDSSPGWLWMVFGIYGNFYSRMKLAKVGDISGYNEAATKSGDWIRLYSLVQMPIWEMIMRLTLTKSINDHSYKL